MIRNLFFTEISSNKSLLAISLAVNLMLFVVFKILGEGLMGFVSASTFSFYVCTIVYAVKTNEEKRYRLYAQLPVTPAQVSIATWAYIIFLLCIYLAFWYLFWFTAVEQFSDYKPHHPLSAFFSALALVAAFSVGFNLGTFKPAYLQWVYIGCAVGSIIITAILTDLAEDVSNPDTSLSFFPIFLWQSGPTNTLFLLLLSAILVAADYYVYNESDSYLS